MQKLRSRAPLIAASLFVLVMLSLNSILVAPYAAAATNNNSAPRQAAPPPPTPVTQTFFIGSGAPAQCYNHGAESACSFSSNRDYFANDGGAILYSPSTTLSVTSTLVAITPTIGECQSGNWSFQFNGYVIAGSKTQLGIMQFVAQDFGSYIDFQEYYVLTNDGVPFVAVTSVPISSNVFTTGASLKISLITNSTGNVLGSIYTGVSASGSTLFNTTLLSSSGAIENGYGGTWQTYAASIVGWEDNLIGDGCGGTATFSSGAGSFSYSANPSVGWTATHPSLFSWVAYKGLGTVEHSNIGYDVPSGSDNGIITPPPILSTLGTTTAPPFHYIFNSSGIFWGSTGNMIGQKIATVSVATTGGGCALASAGSFTKHGTGTTATFTWSYSSASACHGIALTNTGTITVKNTTNSLDREEIISGTMTRAGGSGAISVQSLFPMIVPSFLSNQVTVNATALSFKSNQNGLGLNWAALSSDSPTWSSGTSTLTVTSAGSSASIVSYTFDPTTVGTTTTSPFANGGQGNQIIYAQSLYWVFYSDGTNFVYRTSSNGGSTWGSSNTLRSGTGASAGGKYLSLEYSGSKFCYGILSSTTTKVLVRCGTLGGGGTVTLYSTEQTVTFGEACACNSGGAYIAIQNDSSNNIWLALFEGNSPYKEQVFEGTSCGASCTWTSSLTTASGTGNGQMFFNLGSTEMGFVYGDCGSGNGPFEVRTWSGSAWSSQVTSASSYVCGNGGDLSAVSVGTTMYIAGGENSGSIPIYFNDCTYPCASITQIGSVATSSHSSSFVMLATDGAGTFVVTYLDSSAPTTTLDYTSCTATCTTNTNWSGTTTLTSGETSISATNGAGTNTINNGCAAVGWGAGAASPYNVRFATVLTCTTGSFSATLAPTLSLTSSIGQGLSLIIRYTESLLTSLSASINSFVQTLSDSIGLGSAINQALGIQVPQTVGPDGGSSRGNPDQYDACPCTLSVTTYSPNALIIIYSYDYATSGPASCPTALPEIVSISGGGLSWNNRLVSPEFCSVSAYAEVDEEWYATAPSPLSGTTITLTYSSSPANTQVDIAYIAFDGVNTASPFSGVGCSGEGASSMNPSCNITFANQHSPTMIITSADTGDVLTAPLGYTFSTLNQGSAGPIVAYNTYTVPQTNLGVTWTQASSTEYIILADAIQQAPLGPSLSTLINQALGIQVPQYVGPDGGSSGSNIVEYGSTACPCTISVTTYSPNSLIILYAYDFTSVVGPAICPTTLPQVASISGGGLTWNNRLVSPQYCTPHVYAEADEEWYAIAPTPLSGTTITVTISPFPFGDAVSLSYIAFDGVNTASPFSGNGCSAEGQSNSPSCDITFPNQHSPTMVITSVDGSNTLTAPSGYQYSTLFQQTYGPIVAYNTYTSPRTNLNVSWSQLISGGTNGAYNILTDAIVQQPLGPSLSEFINQGLGIIQSIGVTLLVSFTAVTGGAFSVVLSPTLSILTSINQGLGLLSSYLQGLGDSINQNLGVLGLAGIGLSPSSSTSGGVLNPVNVGLSLVIGQGAGSFTSYMESLSASINQMTTNLFPELVSLTPSINQGLGVILSTTISLITTLTQTLYSTIFTISESITSSVNQSLGVVYTYIDSLAPSIDQDLGIVISTIVSLLTTLTATTTAAYAVTFTVMVSITSSFNQYLAIISGYINSLIPFINQGLTVGNPSAPSGPGNVFLIIVSLGASLNQGLGIVQAYFISLTGSINQDLGIIIASSESLLIYLINQSNNNFLISATVTLMATVDQDLGVLIQPLLTLFPNVDNDLGQAVTSSIILITTVDQDLGSMFSTVINLFPQVTLNGFSQIFISYGQVISTSFNAGLTLVQSPFLTLTSSIDQDLGIVFGPIITLSTNLSAIFNGQGHYAETIITTIILTPILNWIFGCGSNDGACPTNTGGGIIGDIDITTVAVALVLIGAIIFIFLFFRRRYEDEEKEQYIQTPFIGNPIR